MLLPTPMHVALRRLVTNSPKIYLTNGLRGCYAPGMEARDFRGIGRPAQEALRRRALCLIEQQGMSQAEAALAVGVHRQTVNIWLKRYRAQGEDGVLDGRRVSPRRGKGLLTADEAGKVRGWIRDKTPDQLKLPFALWTSRAVRDLIALRFAKRLGLSTVQLYLQRWGMTPQKPLARAKERSPAAIAAWLEQQLPGDRQARQGRAGGDLLGRRDRDLQPRPDRAVLCAPRPDPGGRPDRQADHPEHDLGGQQSWPDALHALRRGAERRPLHRLPAPADQGCRAEGRS